MQGHAVVGEKAGAIAGPPLLREGPAAVPGQAEGERMDFETVPSAGHAVPLATVHSLLPRNLRKHREQRGSHGKVEDAGGGPAAKAANVTRVDA